MADSNPTFKLAAPNRMAWGLWQDDADTIYVAVFSDQVVKKIDPRGKVTIVYQSAGNWTPLHGVFDNNHQLWILESSDKNEVRVVSANSSDQPVRQGTFAGFSACNHIRHNCSNNDVGLPVFLAGNAEKESLDKKSCCLCLH